MKRIRLSPIKIGNVTVQRDMLPVEYRAFCIDCKDSAGPWRSIWNDWDTLVSEITSDLTNHLTRCPNVSISDVAKPEPTSLVQSRG